jgi:hypothetical protein
MATKTLAEVYGAQKATVDPLLDQLQAEALREEWTACEEQPSKLARLVPRDYLRGSPEDLVHLDWSSSKR